MVGSEIKKLWTGRCDVYNLEKTVNRHGITKSDFIKVLEDIPCRLSYKTINYNADGKAYNIPTQIIKLFLSSDIVVKSGSLIEVTQNGITRKYKHSGVGAFYTHHQEIILTIDDGKA